MSCLGEGSDSETFTDAPEVLCWWGPNCETSLDQLGSTWMEKQAKNGDPPGPCIVKICNVEPPDIREFLWSNSVGM